MKNSKILLFTAASMALILASAYATALTNTINSTASGMSSIASSSSSVVISGNNTTSSNISVTLISSSENGTTAVSSNISSSSGSSASSSPPSVSSGSVSNIACTMDVKQCSDGSYVARNPAANCSFYPCPISSININLSDNMTPENAPKIVPLPEQIVAPIPMMSSASQAPIIRATDQDRGYIGSGPSSVNAEYTGQLEVRNSKILMNTSAGEKQISILPEDAINLSETPVKDMIMKVTLEEKEQKPVYSVIGKKEVKFLYLIPLTMEVQTDVDAETGKVISVNKPWWSFLVGG